MKRARGARQLGRTTGPDPRGASGLRFPVVNTTVARGLQAALVLQGPHRRSGLSSAVGPSSVRPARRPLHSLANGRIPQRFLTKRSRRTEKPSRGDRCAARPARCARPHCAGPSSPRTSARAAVRQRSVFLDRSVFLLRGKTYPPRNSTMRHCGRIGGRVLIDARAHRAPAHAAAQNAAVTPETSPTPLPPIPAPREVAPS